MTDWVRPGLLWVPAKKKAGPTLDEATVAMLRDVVALAKSWLEPEGYVVDELSVDDLSMSAEVRVQARGGVRDACPSWAVDLVEDDPHAAKQRDWALWDVMGDAARLKSPKEQP